MWRIALLLLLLFPLASLASNPFSMEGRLNPFVDKSATLQNVDYWQQQTEQLDQQVDKNQLFLSEFDRKKQQLLQQIEQPLSTDVDRQIDLSQQASMTRHQLQELKSSQQTLTSQQAQLQERFSELPVEQQQVQQQLLLLQQQSSESAIANARLHYYEQLQLALTVEQQALPKEQQLGQLQQRLVKNQQADLERRLNNINQALALVRRQQTEAAINAASQDAYNDASLSQLSEQNARYAQALAQTNRLLEEINQQLLELEQRYQGLSLEYHHTQEQLQWNGTNQELGQALLQRLKRLAQIPQQGINPEPINQARLAHYDYELQREQLQQLRQQKQHNEANDILLERQYQLLQQLLQANEQLVVDFNRQQLQQEQLNSLSLRYSNLITENLLWLANSPAITEHTLTELLYSFSWLFNEQRWQEILTSYHNTQPWWGIWLMLTVLLAVIFDLSRKPMSAERIQLARYVGNVTQDKFRDSIAALLLGLGFSIILPAPLWLAGQIFYYDSSAEPFIHALGAAILSIALIAQCYCMLYQLAHPNGLLVAHFRRNAPLVARTLSYLGPKHLIAAPLVAIITFTEVLDVVEIRDSLGRIAFMLLCALLFFVYRRLTTLIEEYHQFHSHHGSNRRLLERLLWQVLIVMPIIAVILTVQGYYYSAQQLMGQAQLTVTVGTLFLLIYLMIKRRILIERRRLQLAQARARRAELLAQREKERSEGTLGSDLGQDLADEPQIDLDTISTQSLGLMRTLLILGYVFSLVALWSQTHPAVFSFLDSITLYSSVQQLAGIEQAIPITLKSIVAAGLLAGFSYLIATNLPGLLELAVLQRLDLTPGTGFAISTISKYTVYLLGTLATSSALGLSWNQMQWLIAALTVGLGFGLQEIFANFISGLIILFEKPIRIGDTVTIRELTGTVSKIQIRATTIVDWDRKEIIVPNKAFITEQLINWSLSDPITRVILKITVSRDSDPALVDAVLHQAVAETPLALDKPEPEIFFDGFAGHTQNFEVRVYCDDMGKRWPLRHDLHMRINAKFKEQGIIMAYPQLDLHINNDIKESSLFRG